MSLDRFQNFADRVLKTIEQVKEAKLSEGPGNAVPIGYTYDAGLHCPDCTEKQFGGWKAGNRWIEGVDNEGNEITPMYSWDNSPPEGYYCGDCGEVISAPYGAGVKDESKLKASKAKVEAKGRAVAKLESLVDAAYDLTAQHMMEGVVPEAGRLLGRLEAKFKAIQEGWFVLPMLGLGNN